MFSFRIYNKKIKKLETTICDIQIKKRIKNNYCGKAPENLGRNHYK